MSEGRKPLRVLTHAEIEQRIADTDPAPALVGTLGNETSARGGLEALRGAAYSEAEWDEAAANLRAFVRLMAEWSARP